MEFSLQGVFKFILIFPFLLFFGLTLVLVVGLVFGLGIAAAAKAASVLFLAARFVFERAVHRLQGTRQHGD